MFLLICAIDKCNQRYVKIIGRENVDQIVGEIDKMGINKNYINYFVVPVVA